MQNDISREDLELLTDIDLSRRTKKKFAKVKSIFNDKIEKLENEKLELISEIDLIKKEIINNSSEEINDHTLSIEKENIPEKTKAYKDYLKAREESENLQKELFPYSSSMSNYGSEIVLFSIIVGLIFDFLLWKDIFSGKFGIDAWAERAERASAIIISFSYAFICSQLGSAYSIKMLTKKRSDSFIVKEQQIYKKATAKDSLGVSLFLFILLTTLSTAARFTQPLLSLSDKFILSISSTSIGLVISAVAYWYTDVYEHFIKAAKAKEVKAKKNYYKTQKRKL